MNSTSACDRGGKVALDVGGSVLLGFPGAPGCTTTGDFAESACCTRAADEQNAAKPLVVISRTSGTATSRTDCVPRPPQKQDLLTIAADPGIFDVLTYHELALGGARHCLAPALRHLDTVFRYQLGIEAFEFCRRHSQQSFRFLHVACHDPKQLPKVDDRW